MQRRLELPTPGSIPAVEVITTHAPVVESENIENVASNAVQNLKLLVVDSVVGETARVSKISPEDVITLETVSV